MKILSLWSGPRNVSTALMYAFAQRPDTQVVDEPLYAHYLAKTNANHPGYQEVLDTMENDGQVVMQQLLAHDTNRRILFLKNMAHHWIDMNVRLLNEMQHLFLIRDPKEMLASLIHQIPDPVLRDTGLQTQVELYKTLEKQGMPPVIIDSRELLQDPGKILKAVCKSLEIPFDEAMLTWKPGPRREDGVWARYWYQNVHRSTGFTEYQPKTTPFPENLKPLLEVCYPYYKFLNDRALKN